MLRFTDKQITIGWAVGYVGSCTVVELIQNKW